MIFNLSNPCINQNKEVNMTTNFFFDTTRDGLRTVRIDDLQTQCTAHYYIRWT
uniref:Uncharacterized protein n=1 Tax=Rhizophora mucronata TaxID=61149 RepID=A0A2P2Q7X5_RHIMU